MLVYQRVRGSIQYLWTGWIWPPKFCRWVRHLLPWGGLGGWRLWHIRSHGQLIESEATGVGGPAQRTPQGSRELFTTFGCNFFNSSWKVAPADPVGPWVLLCFTWPSKGPRTSFWLWTFTTLPFVHPACSSRWASILEAGICHLKMWRI